MVALFLIIDENHLYPPDIKAISSETQSIASLDLPMPTINSINQDDTSQKGISDNISFTSSNNNEIINLSQIHKVYIQLLYPNHRRLGKSYFLFKIIFFNR